MITLCFALLVGTGFAQSPLLTKAPKGPIDDLIHPQRVIVKFKPASKTAARKKALAAKEVQSTRSFKTFPGLNVVQLRPGTRIADVLAKYRKDPNVLFAEPDLRVHTMAMPNDPSFVEGKQWALHNTGQDGGIDDADVDAPEAWDQRHSANDVIVAVIDTGVRYTHEDLAANMWVNPGEKGRDASGNDKATNGIDDDANGFIDDVHGINAITRSGDPMDDHLHGTHCAGIAGAVGNNGKGIAGIAWGVKIMACKFMDAGGSGYTSDAITCIDYARSKGAKVMSNSWGGGGFSQSLKDAVAAAREEGVIFVAAAGNEYMDADLLDDVEQVLTPAGIALDNVVSVGASTSRDLIADFSNRGMGGAHLMAPGDEILSCGIESDRDYAVHSGTSMATPLVAGAAALLKAQFPGDSYLQTIRRLMNTVDRAPAYRSKCAAGGRINVQRALASTSTRPWNDDFASAEPITGNGFHLVGDTHEATSESSEPEHAGQAASPSLWWSWTPSKDGVAEFSTHSATFDTVLAVYQGESLDALTLVASNDDLSETENTSSVSFETKANETYRIVIAGHGGAMGTFRMKGTFHARPDNDRFANATLVAGGDYKVLTKYASAEIGEPSHVGATATHSIWYKWTPTRTRAAMLSTAGSDFDTVLAVYQGDALNALSEVASNDNAGPDVTTSAVTFTANAGTTYYVVVDGADGATGESIITFPAANDDLAQALEVVGTEFGMEARMNGATREDAEPLHAGVASPRTLWWKWTAERSGPLGISASSNECDSLIAVYEDSTMDALTQVAANNDAPTFGKAAQVIFDAIEGKTYLIAIGSVDDVDGSIRVQASAKQVPMLVALPGAAEGFWCVGANGKHELAGHRFDDNFFTKATRWSPTTGFRFLSDEQSAAYSINDAGWACGFIGSRPALWDPEDVLHPIGDEASPLWDVVATAINDSKVCAGYGTDGRATYALRLDGNGQTVLPLAPGFANANAWDINNAGTLVGMVYTIEQNTLVSMPAKWEGGKVTVLSLPTGYQFGMAGSIDDAGVITGTASIHPDLPIRPVIWKNGVPTIIAIPENGGQGSISGRTRAGDYCGEAGTAFAVRKGNFEYLGTEGYDPEGRMAFNSVMMGEDGLCVTNGSDYRAAKKQGAMIFTPVNTFTAPPTEQTVYAGTHVTLNAVPPRGVTGAKFQWLRSGSPLTDDDRAKGATTATLKLTAVEVWEAGRYACEVTWTNGRTQSVHLLSVLPKAIIVVQGQAASMGVQPSAVEEYRWMRNGVPLVDRWDGDAYFFRPSMPYLNVFAETMEGTAGLYTLRRRANGKDSISPAVNIVVVRAPNQRVTVASNSTLALDQPFAGAGVTFQWKRFGEALSDGALHSGTRTSRLVINEVSPADHRAQYVCIVRAGDHEQQFALYTLEVGPPDTRRPTITTASLASIGLGNAFSQSIAATSYPSRFIITGLPPGVSFDSRTGKLSGRPTVAGTFLITIKAVNAYGISDPVSIWLTVGAMPAGTTGRFFGLIDREIMSTGKQGGTFDLTISNTGSYTGTVRLGLSLYRVQGQAKREPARVIIDQPLVQSAASDAMMHLEISNHEASGSFKPLGMEEFASNVSGAHVDWVKSTGSAVPVGRHNVLLSPPSANELEAPQGVSFGTATITGNGTVLHTLRLADGSSTTMASFLGKDMSTPVFALPYAQGGSVHGRLRLSVATEAAPSTVEGQITWSKHRAVHAQRLYPKGFEPIACTASGMLWKAPEPGKIVLGLDAKPLNAQLQFMSPEVEAAVASPNIALTLSAPAKVKLPLANPCLTKLAIDPATGLISGSFILSDSNPGPSPRFTTRSATFFGMCSRDGTGPVALGYFLVPQHPANGDAGISGRVVLRGNTGL